MDWDVASLLIFSTFFFYALNWSKGFTWVLGYYFTDEMFRKYREFIALK